MNIGGDRRVADDLGTAGPALNSVVLCEGRSTDIA